MAAIRKERSLSPIVKYESLVVNGIDKSINKDIVQRELEKIFKIGEQGVKDIKVIANNLTGEPLGHAYVNYINIDKGIVYSKFIYFYNFLKNLKLCIKLIMFKKYLKSLIFICP